MAKVFAPDSTNQTALVNAISAAVAGVKSCVFDLGNIDGKSIHVDLNALDQANVVLMGTKLARSDTDGWRMSSATQLELVGAACAMWRTPAVDNIDFQFPCGSIILE